MGYFIHLYTDYFWFKYFITEFYSDDMVTKLDGTVVKCTGNMMVMYIYNDYSNLNIRLLDEYCMDLNIFYNEIPKFSNIIEEVPMDKIQLIVDRASVIIENSKLHKDFIFNIENIKQFISICVDLILSELYDIL